MEVFKQKYIVKQKKIFGIFNFLKVGVGKGVVFSLY